MPRGDGTGPRGQGTGTGRGVGPCKTHIATKLVRSLEGHAHLIPELTSCPVRGLLNI